MVTQIHARKHTLCLSTNAENLKKPLKLMFISYSHVQCFLIDYIFLTFFTFCEKIYYHVKNGNSKCKGKGPELVLLG
jgi:hypothetical protein